MRDAACQLSDRLHLLRLTQLCLEGALLRDIENHRDEQWLAIGAVAEMIEGDEHVPSLSGPADHLQVGVPDALAGRGPA